MHHLLEFHRPPTLAAFFGLILGSSWLVGRAVQPDSNAGRSLCLMLALLGAVVGLTIAMQGLVTARPGSGYTFLCGAVAICAMILPGISGAHILLLLGKYEEITGIIKKLPRLDVSMDELIALAVFAAGCLVGLILFSKFLRWLLGRWHAQTMSVLCGFMIGSLYRIWPFQQDMSPGQLVVKHKHFQPMLPEAISGEVVACGVIAIVALASVLLLDWWAGRVGRTERHAA
jgi:putative membrane protein